MKFSYSLIKKLAPGIPSAVKLADLFNLHAFEVEEVAGDVMDIKIPANRWSGVAHHIGVAREAAAIAGKPFKDPVATLINTPEKKGLLSVTVENTDACARYKARVFDIKKIGKSPAWMQNVLVSCGMKPINAVVDIMNYVMLEVGQPLHAFDAATLAGDKKKTIIVRNARKGETIETLDGQKIALDPSVLLIADASRPLAIAGIKGGQDSGVTASTKRIIVEAANFDPVRIYKTVRAIALATDASARFQHDLSPALVSRGMDRATVLLAQICGAVAIDGVDSYPVKRGDGIVDFDPQKYEKLVGDSITVADARKIFLSLGFEVSQKAVKGKQLLRVRIPAWRSDIERMEDLTDEVVRLRGLSRVKVAAPHVKLSPAMEDDSIVFKDRVRMQLGVSRLNEIYNYSFVGAADLEYLASAPNVLFGNSVLPVRVANPISDERTHLRPSLVAGLYANVADNARYFEQVRIYEVGKAFGNVSGVFKEKLSVAFAIAAKKDARVVFEVKGIAHDLLSSFGITDTLFVEEEGVLHIESGKHILGQISLAAMTKGWFGAFCELDGQKIMETASEKRAYAPLPRFPSVSRDITFMVSAQARIGDIMVQMQEAGPDILEDVDLVDEYADESMAGNQSITFRCVFQAADRTLEDKEVTDAMSAIQSSVAEKFGATLR